MKHVYEFEVFLDEGRYTVWPFDFECGGTSGATFREACEMAVDWLKTVVEDYAMHDEATPEPTFDNEPRYGGRIITVAIDAGLETEEGAAPRLPPPLSNPRRIMSQAR